MESSIYITLETLKYLKKGGRITPAAAALGTVLNLKPVLQIQGEKLDAFAKARGKKQAELKKMSEMYGMDIDKLKEYMGDSEKESIKRDLAVQKAVEVIMDNIKERAKAKTKKEKEDEDTEE